MATKTEQVRLFFESPDRYLCRREFDIRVRMETVEELYVTHFMKTGEDTRAEIKK